LRPSQVCSRRRVEGAFPRVPGPRAVRPFPVSRSFSSGDRADRFCFGLSGAIESEMNSASGLRSRLRSMPAVKTSGMILPWASSSCRFADVPMKHHRRRTVVVSTPQRSRAPDPTSRIDPLMGFRRPLAQTCRPIQPARPLARAAAQASPALQRFTRLVPGQFGGDEPPNQLPV